MILTKQMGLTLAEAENLIAGSDSGSSIHAADFGSVAAHTPILKPYFPRTGILRLRYPPQESLSSLILNPLSEARRVLTVSKRVLCKSKSWRGGLVAVDLLVTMEMEYKRRKTVSCCS